MEKHKPVISNRPYSTANMNILLCDMHVTSSPLMRYTNVMVELSDSFKQLDTVGKLRYEEKLGMLWVTTDPYSTSRHVWPAHKVFSSHQQPTLHESFWH